MSATRSSQTQTLGEPERLRAQQEISAHAADCAAVGDLHGTVAAGEHQEDRARVGRTGIKHPFAAAAWGRDILDHRLGRGRQAQEADRNRPGGDP
jgi:hypothetical protein